jgi:hypothetical protein
MGRAVTPARHNAAKNNYSFRHVSSLAALRLA